jgi:4-amino-4-deoxy-L-arabinose transferase-like glycosyltransferase
MVGVLIVLTYAFTRAYFDTRTGLLAAGIVAFLPDVLGHGGVAYNDVPLAAAFLAALWAIERAVRNPSVIKGLVAGLLISLALGIKHSALALGPIAIVLVIMEAIARPDRRAWLPRMAAALAVGLLGGYVLQVAIYQGDPFLLYLVEGTHALANHVSQGHAVTDPRGGFSLEGGWRFYPRALAIKTSAAFQLLLLLGAIGGVLALRQDGNNKLLRGGARAPLVACIIFGAILMRAKLVIGFRYALPMIPLLVILTAAGCMVLWSRRKIFAVVITAAVIWAAGSTLSFYPYFLAYSSEYPPGRDQAYTQLFDSSLDWGQGLIALREFMREENIDLVYLAYFGSAIPEGYGIKYVPLPSFYPLPQQPAQPAPPKFAVVSATLLSGRYLKTDFYAEPRTQKPYRVLGHSMYVFKADE